MKNVPCYNIVMVKVTPFTVPDEIGKEIDMVSHMTRKSVKQVLRELVKAGLKDYRKTSEKSVQSLLELAAWAEKNNIAGPKDLSTNHNKYAWE
jgi:hypothetical protein